MRSKKHRDWSRYLPCGFDAARQRRVLFVMTGLVLLWAALCFGTRLQFALREYSSGMYIYIKDFYLVMGNTLAALPIALAAMCALACIYYSSHWDGSRSIYLMRRLPRRWELHRRCLTVPLLGIVFFLLLGLIMTMAMYGIYLLAAPEDSVAPDQLKKLLEYGSIFMDEM